MQSAEDQKQIAGKSTEGVEIVGESGAVIEAGGFAEIDVRINTLVDIIEGTVFQEGHAVAAGNLEDGAISRGGRQHHAAATTGGFTNKSDLLGGFQRSGNQVAAGEADRRDQA